MELPKRKVNRLPEYDYSGSGAYFITICVRDKSPILCSIIPAADARTSGPAVGGEAKPGPSLAPVGGEAKRGPSPAPVGADVKPGPSPAPVGADAKPGPSPTPVGADALIGPKCQLSAKGQTVRKYIESMSRTEGVNVDKYVIMPNHIHLLISIDSGPMRASAPTASIPGIIRSFKGLVTKALGENIFQRSYHDHIIRNEADYLLHWNYIDTNPARWDKDEYYF